MLTKIVNGERVELTQEEIDARQAEIDNYVEPIPSSVSLIQAKIAIDESELIFNELNLTDSIAAFINLLPPKTKRQAKLRWNHSQIVRRENGLVTQILSGVGLTGLQIDELFTAASKVE